MADDLRILTDGDESDWIALERQIEGQYYKIGPARQDENEQQGTLL